MKKIFFTIAMIGLFCKIFAQDNNTTIKTPTNISIEAIYRVEFSTNQLEEVEAAAADWISDYNSNAMRLAPASRTYNCHNYAWHNSDGGNRVWVNQNDQYGNANLSKYWSGTSPTYQLTTIGNATKAFYANGDHSAKVISPTLFESKWGPWPRYQHSPTDCPYVSSNLQYYYVPVDGDEVICTSKTYTTLNISGASYDWSGSNITLSGSGSSRTASKLSDGSGWVQAQISSTYSGTVITSEKQYIWSGAPLTPTSINGFCCNGMRFKSDFGYNFSINSENKGIEQCNWIVSGGNIIRGQGTKSIDVWTAYAPPAGIAFNVSVRAGNSCGLSGYLQRSSFIAPFMGYSIYSIYPNPAKSDVTMSVSDSKSISDTLGVSEDISITNIYFFDKSGNIKKNIKTNLSQKSVTINVSDLQKGIYLVKISYGLKEESHKLIIE